MVKNNKKQPRINRNWTTLWDRKNRRVLLLAGPKAGSSHWGFVKHDVIASRPSIYDIWRRGKDGGDIVFVEIHLDDKDSPLGFPDDLLPDRLLGSPTIWPAPNSNYPSFIWWHARDSESRSFRMRRRSPAGTIAFECSTQKRRKA
jgi:hypothetical protein